MNQDLPPLAPGLNRTSSPWTRVPLVYWVPAALTFLLVLFWPLLGLHESAVVTRLAQWMTEWLPFLERHERASSIAGAMITLKCATLISIPILVLTPFVVQWPHARPVVANYLANDHKLPWSVEFGMLLVLSVMMVGLWVIPSVESWLVLAILHSGAAVAFAILPISAAVAFYIRLCRLVLPPQISRTSRHRRNRKRSDA